VNAGPFEIEFEELAPGVWAGVRPDGPRFPVMGSVTFVISDEGVVVFDGGGMPIISEKVIDKIQSITDAPVTHVVISHWHGDHNFGIYRFVEEYPDVKIVAHRFTEAVMKGSRIQYIKRYPDYIAKNMPKFTKALQTGAEADGMVLTASDRIEYERIIEDADEIDVEFKRARITMPTVVFDDEMIINSGRHRIELKRLGAGNTDGDIVMWLPNDKMVATGDLVVLPTPYAFNVPPRAWAATLQRLNDLDYRILVPGHGNIQRDTRYVDLNIEAALSIADQRDRMLAEGLSYDEIEEQLDFAAFEQRFTGGDEYLTGYYQAYFVKPFRKAAIKELSGEPMVPIEVTE
jgi:glyoxylase-like metal-dependent hydrolase (beta-lactamase superfamily II)